MAVTFDTLKPDARIFLELNNNPHWWKQFKEDSSLYIEVRKDNQVNVYFEGGSIARIHYCSKNRKLQVFIHHKYLGIPKPADNNLYVEYSDKITSTLNACYEYAYANEDSFLHEFDKWNILGSYVWPNSGPTANLKTWQAHVEYTRQFLTDSLNYLKWIYIENL